jgi:DNA primase
VFYYLVKKRGISPATAIKAGVAYVIDYSAAADWLRQRASMEELQAAGLFNAKKNFKLFKHRLILPYWCDGEVAMMQVRNIDWRNKEEDGPKELTIGPVTVPFNANVLLEAQETVHICEGAIDTLSLLELGLIAVGIPGARSFRPQWCELFEDVQEVVLALDNDAAGDEGAAAIAGNFRLVGRDVKRLMFPPGIKDANELLLASSV